MKLISMTSFVLQQANYTDVSNISEKYATIWNYANFLKKPLKLEMFVPCDENGNILEKPERRCSLIGFDEQHYDYDDEELRIYSEANERVLFKGFEYIKTDHNFYIFNESELIRLDQSHFHGTVTVEYISAKNVELTETGIKQIGL